MNGEVAAIFQQEEVIAAETAEFRPEKVLDVLKGSYRTVFLRAALPYLALLGEHSLV